MSPIPRNLVDPPVETARHASRNGPQQVNPRMHPHTGDAAIGPRQRHEPERIGPRNPQRPNRHHTPPLRRNRILHRGVPPRPQPQQRNRHTRRTTPISSNQIRSPHLAGVVDGQGHGGRLPTRHPVRAGYPLHPEPRPPHREDNPAEHRDSSSGTQQRQIRIPEPEPGNEQRQRGNKNAGPARSHPTEPPHADAATTAGPRQTSPPRRPDLRSAPPLMPRRAGCPAAAPAPTAPRHPAPQPP